MGKLTALLLALAAVHSVGASWYWPFGSSDDGPEQPRISELMEPATALIDEASDLAADGKTAEAIEKYRRVLAELDRIERENAERAKSAEFATLRNKRAYVNAAIDAMLLGQVKGHAKAVAVSDTTELEKKLAAEDAAKKSAAAKKLGEGKKPVAAEKKSASAAKEPTVAAKSSAVPKTWRGRVAKCIAEGDYKVAEAQIDEMLRKKPGSAMALNLKAMAEEAQGRAGDAAKTLERAMLLNPRNYYAFYNMAALVLRRDAGETVAARRYYETGRALGGPEDKTLEAAFK